MAQEVSFTGLRQSPSKQGSGRGPLRFLETAFSETLNDWSKPKAEARNFLSAADLEQRLWDQLKVVKLWALASLRAWSGLLRRAWRLRQLVPDPHSASWCLHGLKAEHGMNAGWCPAYLQVNVGG